MVLLCICGIAPGVAFATLCRKGSDTVCLVLHSLADTSGVFLEGEMLVVPDA